MLAPVDEHSGESMAESDRRDLGIPREPPGRGSGDLRVHVESEVAAPITTLFEVIEDLELFASLEANTTSVIVTSSHQRGLGVRSRWTALDPENGEEKTFDEEIVHYDKPHQYAYVGGGEGWDYAGVHTLSKNPDGTTHHEFNEIFHFEADRAHFEAAVNGMVTNAKIEAERRYLENRS